MSVTPSTVDSKPVVWVTGSGAPRVGQCVAEYFGVRGYRVVIHTCNSVDEAEKFATSLNARGIESLVVRGAVEEEDFAKSAVTNILETFGRLDVLVNSAAIWNWRPLEETTKADVQRQFEVNSLGTFLCSQAAGLQMAKQASGGSIVLIGDWAVHRPYRDFAAYFAGKGAIETMTRSFAIELASRNPAIRVNAVLPGPVLLDPSISESKAESIRNQSLLKRQGEAKHVAQAAYFLATHEFITGVCLPVDGGRSIYPGATDDAIAHPTLPKT